MNQENRADPGGETSEQDEDFARKKLQREVEMLELELKDAKRPFFQRSSFLLPILSAIVLAVVATIQAIAMQRLSSEGGAVSVLQEKISQHGFNSSSLWAIWHVLDERQRLGDVKARDLLVGIKSLDFLVTQNYPASSPSYSLATLREAGAVRYELRVETWPVVQAGGMQYIFRSEALRYLLSLRQSIERLDQVLAKESQPVTWASGKAIDVNDMVTLSAHRDELRKTYKQFSKLIGRNPRFIEAGNYVIANLLDTQID